MTPAKDDGALAVRPRDAAKLLAISERTLWGLSAPRGPIPCVRLGDGTRQTVRYSIDALRQYLAEASKPDQSKGVN